MVKKKKGSLGTTEQGHSKTNVRLNGQIRFKDFGLETQDHWISPLSGRTYRDRPSLVGRRHGPSNHQEEINRNYIKDPLNTLNT